MQDLDAVYLARTAARDEVRAAASPATLRDALRRLFPCPARARYVAVSLLPQRPLLARLARAPSFYKFVRVWDSGFSVNPNCHNRSALPWPCSQPSLTQRRGSYSQFVSQLSI